MMTKTAVRAVNSQIRGLQRERRGWLAGHGLPWGTPWCGGPGELGHQADLCDGCATFGYCRDRAAELTERIGQLQASLPGDADAALARAA